MPSLADFVDRCTDEFGCSHGQVPGAFSTPSGAFVVRALYRGLRFAPLPQIPDSQPLQPSQVRSLCAQLDIPVDAFGLAGDSN
jgi:hypothetical protein